MNKLDPLEIKIPQGNEYTVEQTLVLLANFATQKKGFFASLVGREKPVLSLEIVCFQQKIHFVAGVPQNKNEFFQSQLLAQYKDAVITPVNDYLDLFKDRSDLAAASLKLTKPYWHPLKTFEQFKDTDPLSSVLAIMAKTQNPDDLFVFQLLLSPAGRWQSKAGDIAQTGGGKDVNGRHLPHQNKNQIEEKISQPGFAACLRILADSQANLEALCGGFGVFSQPQGGNQFKTAKPKLFGKNKLIKSIISRSCQGRKQILNIKEIASLWHLPTGLVSLPNISWGRAFRSEPPENLPRATNLNEEEKRQITFIGKTEFKNQVATFGIKRNDRGRHVYTIGKTGTGKSTLIANMAIEDIRKGSGVAVIDPHGDLAQIILNYIPSGRINDVCYFNPADPEFSYPLNILEVKNPAQRELVASGIVSIFHKLYAHSWGPRLEHVLRNTLLTLTAIPNTTLVDVIRILTEEGFRNKLVGKLDEQPLKSFWQNEFAPMGERLRQETISPILNKVGQFVSSPLIRQIINQPKSKVSIEKIMNEGRIIIIDLSQGKIGEDNAALLGAMIITQIQLSAMNRVFIPEAERKPFYLFVDEFQNFATRSFIKILSEARKYRLNLAVANQYMAQLDRDIQDAILGNVGTLISFLVGAQDAQVLEKEFGKNFFTDDLVSLEKFQVLLKLSVDMQTSNPFYAHTMPLPKCANKNKEKVINASRQRYGRRKFKTQNSKLKTTT